VKENLYGEQNTALTMMQWCHNNVTFKKFHYMPRWNPYKIYFSDLSYFKNWQNDTIL